MMIEDEGRIVIGTNENRGRLDIINHEEGWSYGLKIDVNHEHTKAIAIKNQNNSEEVFRVFGNGVVNAKTVRAQRLKIEEDYLKHWPDYVLEPGYNLMTLNDLAEFIEINNHLPDVPSATQVKEEGIELGEIATVYLKKIEELTLYTIQQDKQLKQQGELIKEMSREIEKLKNSK